MEHSIKLHILEDPSTGKKRVSCDLCGTPQSHTLAYGSWRYLDSHRESFKCFQAKSNLQVNQADLQQTMAERLEQGVQGSSKPLLKCNFLSPSFTMASDIQPANFTFVWTTFRNNTSPSIFSFNPHNFWIMSHLLLRCFWILSCNTALPESPDNISILLSYVISS